jgi:hypothetical protein
MTNLLENTFRHINIAVVNQLARLCHDLNIDLGEVIGAASTQPFRLQSFWRGPGASGHCIRIDPHYLSHNMRTQLGYPFGCVEPGEEITTPCRLPWPAASRICRTKTARRFPVRLVNADAYLVLQTTRSMTSPSSPMASRLGRRRHATDLHQRRRTSRPGDNSA